MRPTGILSVAMLVVGVWPMIHAASGVHQEQDGLLVIEMESASLPEDWAVLTDFGNYLGEGYIQYHGKRFGKEASAVVIRYPIQITTPGTYQFSWRSRNGPEAERPDDANDSWLKIEADQYIRTRGDQRSDQTGKFLKVHVKGLDDWDWKPGGRADKPALYATFAKPGRYHIVVSGRSTGHAIDRMVLWHESLTMAQAIAHTNQPSQISK